MRERVSDSACRRIREPAPRRFDRARARWKLRKSEKESALTGEGE